VHGLEEEHVADEPKDMPRALAWRHKALDAVGELHQPYLVVVADGAEGEHRRQFRGHFALLLEPGAELMAAAAIYQ